MVLWYVNHYHRFLTQDLIAYKIASQSPFKIEECAGGTGGPFGGTFLDKRFYDFLCMKLGKQSHLLTEKRWEKIRRSFEYGLKRSFNDTSGDKEIEMGYGVPQIPAIGLVDGQLRVTAFIPDISGFNSRSELRQEVFEPIFKDIVGLIRDQMAAVRAITPGSYIKARESQGMLMKDRFPCWWFRQ